MKVAYCSLLLPEEKKLVERTKERLSGVSLHKLASAVIKGLDSNLDEPLDVFNIINTVNYPGFPQIVFRTEKWCHAEGAEDWHIGYINLFGIKYITQCVGMYRKLKKWVKKQKEKCVICVHHIYFPAMLATYMVKLKYSDKVSICLFTGDMNGKYGLPSQDCKKLKTRMIGFLENGIDSLARKFDSYILVTKPMAEAFGVEEKPYTVLECVYSGEEKDVEQCLPIKSRKEKIIFYAGAIREEYGIMHLLRAFSLIEDVNFRLWIAGGGKAEAAVKEYASKDKRVEFKGFITPKEVAELQNEATIVVSPRTSELDFVKYSFPGKTMECLTSGKPYVAHCLPCDPPEYAEYIQYAADDSDEALMRKIVEVCNLSDEERRKIAEQACAFIVREKNPQRMCEKVTEMWRRLL